MISIDGGAMSLKPKCEGGCWNGCKLCCIGESCCFNYYHLKEGTTTGDVTIAPTLLGEIAYHEIDSEKTQLKMTPKGFLAADQTVDLECKCLSCGEFCASGRCCALLATGHGKVFMNTFGSIAKYELPPGASFKVDNGFVMGWEWNPDLRMSFGLAADSLKDSCFSGEVFASILTNNSDKPVYIFVQTRQVSKFAKKLARYMGNPTAWLAGRGGGGGANGGGGGGGGQ